MKRLPRTRLAPAVLVMLAGLQAACDRSPTALDSVQRDGLRRVVAAAETAGDGSVEASLRDMAWRLATTVEPTPRLPVLEELFERAAERLDDGEAVALRHAHDQLTRDAWAAVDDGRSDDADGALTAARTFMAARTVELLGEPVAAAYVAILGLAIDHAAALMDANGGGLPGRARRILASARNLHGDAGTALLEGDYARAIDVAAHAAGLVNMLETTVR